MKSISVFLCAILLGTATVQADLRLPAVIGDHAMFQADQPVAIWGWAEPGAQVKVAFTGSGVDSSEDFTATSDANGKWSGHLPAMKSGTAGQLAITTDKGGQKTVADVLVGEVWLGGGQSNMAYDIAGKGGGNFSDPVEAAQIKQNVANAQKEAGELKQPIRYFAIAIRGADQPTDDVPGKWMTADPENVAAFSAVAWNFGVALQNKLGVPIGLIVSCVGGTPVEAWMSRETLEGTSVGAAVFDRHAKAMADLTPEKIARYNTDFAAWKAANPTSKQQADNRNSRPKALYSATNNYVPNRFYNGMIHGLEPYTLRGIIWYQADGNNPHPFEYSEMFQAMIKEWRAEWGEQLPFYFVEMNNMYSEPQTMPAQHTAAVSFIREQQHGGLLQPDVGMVAAIDLGIKNPHFPNKKPVGVRLANLALSDCYHLPMGEVNGPRYQGFAIEGGKIRLKFTDAEGLRIRGGGDLKGFIIRGDGGKWVWATGKIDGQNILVWSDQVPAPTSVRYGWDSNPLISVENGAGLPLYPFRTDTDNN